MDQKGLHISEIRPLPSRSRIQGFLFSILTLISLLLAAHLFSLSYKPDLNLKLALKNETQSPDAWSWKNIKPSSDLEWTSCYNGEFECARLDVPMDWQNPTEKQRVVLGVIKLAAKSKDNPVPPLLINPGGPGGSGVNALRVFGPHAQTIAGDNHDVISWDPRGVGVTTPRLDCWASNQKKSLWSVLEGTAVDERPGFIYDAYARTLAYSGVCEDSAHDSGILEHISTAYHARDMLEIVKKTGHQKLRYWGFSYGTILGGVFASLFPDRIERFVSDGNVDYSGWFQRDHSHFFQDADSILLAFDKACHEVGPSRCALWAENPEAITNRRDNVLESLKKKPVLVPANAETGLDMPELGTYSALQLLTRTMLYKPIVFVERIARLYAAMEKGDSAGYLEASSFFRVGTATEQLCTIANIPWSEPQETTNEADAFPAIACADTGIEHGTPDDFVNYLAKLKSVSKWVGAANIGFKLNCVGRNVLSKWRHFPDPTAKIETAHPVLFVNNVHDNVTPLEAAHNNSAYYPGSVVLAQRSYGHCSSAAPSVCTAKHIRNYFQNGTLPEPDTLCEQDYNFFESPQNLRVTGMDELAAATLDMSENAHVGFGASFGF